MSIFKDCDIRGVYGAELRDEDAFRVGRALAAARPGGKFCVGGDVRLSTPVLKAELIRGIVKSGAQVLDMGTIATPVMYYALARGGADGGAMVTASHNPPKYNGVKFMLGNAPVTRADMDAVKRCAQGGAFPEGAGGVSPYPILPDYLAHLQSRFGLSGEGMRVVVDAGNGAMSGIAPQAFLQAGYQVRELFCTPDGRFPNRTPNPAEYDKLTALQAAVCQSKADFGVAFDGDGDRAVFVDNLGGVVISERALVLFIRYLLKARPTPVVYDQKSSSIVRAAIVNMGGEPLPERSGHTFIKRRFLDRGAAVAGEVSGHFFFGELGYDDGLFAALLMGEALRGWGVTMAAALEGVVCPPITPDLRVACAYARQDEVLRAIEAAFPSCPVDRMDGVRIELADGWLLARKSVTAEQLTLRIEGRTEEVVTATIQGLRGIAPELAALLYP